MGLKSAAATCLLLLLLKGRVAKPKGVLSGHYFALSLSLSCSLLFAYSSKHSATYKFSVSSIKERGSQSKCTLLKQAGKLVSERVRSGKEQQKFYYHYYFHYQIIDELFGSIVCSFNVLFTTLCYTAAFSSPPSSSSSSSSPSY